MFLYFVLLFCLYKDEPTRGSICARNTRAAGQLAGVCMVLCPSPPRPLSCLGAPFLIKHESNACITAFWSPQLLHEGGSELRKDP